MKDEKISTNELRFDFGRVLKGLKNERSFLLTYRNQPLGRIIPIDQPKVIQDDDPFFKLSEIAEPIGELSNEEIDRLVYEA